MCTNQEPSSFDLNFWNNQRCFVFYCGLNRNCCNGGIIFRSPETSPKNALGQAIFWPLSGTGNNAVASLRVMMMRQGRKDRAHSCSIKVVQDSSHFRS